LRGWIANLALALASIGVALAAAEGVVRVADLVPRTDQSNAALVLDRSGPFLKFKPGLAAVPYAGMHLSTNAFGYRSAGMSLLKRAGSVRIAVLGDSWAFGWGVEDEASIVHRLEAMLRQAHPEKAIELLNFAVPGHAMADHALVLREAAQRFDPDFCLVLVHINDAQYEGPGQAETPPAGGAARLIPSLKLPDLLYARLVLPLAVALELPNDSYPSIVRRWYAPGSQTRALYERAVGELVGLLRERGMPSAFYLLPVPFARRAPYPLQEMNEVVKAIFAAHGARIEELAETYARHGKDELVLHAFDMHPNPFASGLLAEELAAALGRNPELTLLLN
jgi:lysophospholipase L1-like esterase